MWNRKELKEKAKIAFKANYWKTVLAAIVVGAIGAGVGTASYNGSGSNEAVAELNSLSQSDLLAVVIAVMTALLFVIIVMSLVKIFLLNPLSVGCQKFFKENASNPAELSELGAGFKKNYGNVVLTIFLKDLFLVLWSLLFVIPALVKTYSYRMVEFISADNPEMSATEVITKSRDMMRGNKWKAFVLDLSFIGWLILTGITAGILGIFYVYPYMYQTDAELYLALKNAEAPAEVQE